MSKNICLKIYLLFSGMPTALAASIMSSGLPQMKQFYDNIDQVWIKQLNSIPSLLLSITAPILSLLLVKHIKFIKWILVSGLFFYAIVGSLPFVLYESFPITITMRAFLGFFNGLTEPFSLFLIKFIDKSDVFFGMRATLMSLISLIFNLCGGLIVDKLGFEYLYLIYLLPLLLLVFVVFIDFSQFTDPQPIDDAQHAMLATAPAQDSEKQPQELKQDDLNDQVPEVVQDAKKVQKSLIISAVALFITAFFSQLTYYIVPQSISFRLKELDFDDAFYSGLATGVSMGFNGFASIFYKFLMKLSSHMSFRFRFLTISISGLLVTGSFIVGLAFSDNYYVFLTLLALSGLAMGNQLPNVNAWGSQFGLPYLGCCTFCTFFSHFLTSVVFCSKRETVNLAAAGAVQCGVGLLLSFFYKAQEM